ncbi:putative C57A7.05-like protein [Cladobotryum mycophilum]|uniref:C57A7.05-like protein n=1 Tax=Cladobotryum mycophilum TaxID=491253 RepID=A0ABR0SJ54_9HYPO
MAEGPPPAALRAGNESHDAGSKLPPPPQRKLPAWLDHFNANDLKVVFRCWVAVWAASLLIFIQPTLQNIGVSTFFASIVLYIMPPAGILFIYLLAMITLLVGMCLAWAWGLLSMKAALAARPAAETGQFNWNPPAAIATKLVHEGFMLDVRVTVVFFVMCLAFIYFLARLRCANDKLILLQLFGMIVIDIFLLIGPTLSVFNSKLAQVLVKPGAIGIGIGAACSLLIFPQSTSYVVLRKMEQLVSMGEVALDATRRRFANEPVEVKHLQAAKGNIINVFKMMEPSLAFLPVDLSRGRWNADDVKSLQARVRDTMLAGLFLLDFQIAGIITEQKAQKTGLHGSVDLSQSVIAEKDGHELDRSQTSESMEVITALKTSEQNVIGAETMEILKNTTAEVLQVCSQSIKVAADCIHAVNTCRWNFRAPQKRFDELTQELEETLEKLRLARESCITNTTEAVLKNHADLFDKDGRFKATDALGPYSLAGMVLSMVVEERMFGSADAMEGLLEYLIELMKSRRETRLWLPTRLQYAVDWMIRGKVSIPVAGLASDDTVDPDALEEAHRRLRQSQGTKTRVRKSGLGYAIGSVYTWLINPAGLYAIRMVVVTLATSIPAVLPHTAGFFYREKGIWAVITAQTCLLFYMADFTFSLVSRLLGTIIGGLMGLIAWYIGSAHGNGNPYGMAAITALMAFILIWWRVFLPPAYAQATIMAGATFALIIGFSWDEHHIAQYGLPGIGYVAFWKRLVTVLLGFVAAIIVQLFPRTPSATEHVQKTLANTVRTLSDHYALLLSHWNRSEEGSPLGQAAQKFSLELSETLFSLTGSISLIKVELSPGPFDQKSLCQVQELCQHTNQALGRLLFMSAALPKELQDRMVRTSGLMDERNIGSIMAVLSIIEQSLRTGSPLPERLPTPLVQNCFEAWHAENEKPELSMELIRDEKYRRYCVALSSYLRFLTIVDDLVVVLKETLGESHVIYPWDSQA